MAGIKIALAGNPNAGKTSIFNELTGSNQYVGNWPGVTVEKKEGTLKKNKDVIIQDLPGIYSLSPYTPEEIISRDYLLNGHPDVVVDVIDSTNLERNLYLTTQLLELGIPVLIDLNMTDLLHKNGDTINVEKLAYSLNSKVVETSASSGKGIKELIKAMTSTHEVVDPQMPEYPLFDNRCEVALDEIQSIIQPLIPKDQLRWYTIKFFERDELVKKEINLSDKQQAKIEDVITTAEEVFGDDSDSIIINERYEFIAKVVQLCRVSSANNNMKISDKIDRIVTNRWLGLPIFALVMFLIYYLSIQTIGTMGTDWVNDVLFGEIVPNAVSNVLQAWNVADWMQSLILDGIIAGVGAVLGFLPQIIVMFLCLAFLEDCGYMARVAFVMDRIFRKFGLSGKSFIPMLISVGCGVPGVMASRTIENEKDRRMTVMVTTMMPCSAKLPIIALIAGAFFPNNPFIFPSAYFVGMAAIIFSGIVLKKTKLFAGDPAPFIMELPAYHMPKLKGVLLKTWERSSAFVKKAGTIILVSSIVLWFLMSFNFKFQMVSEDQSILAAIGGVIAIIFTPLGWGDWRAAVAAVTGLIAKENIVNTFGVLFKGLEEVSENGDEIWGALSASFTPVAGYSFLLFNLLCAPCFAAIGSIHREMGDMKWTMIAVGYQCGLAYVVSFVFYQIAAFVTGIASFGIGQIIAGIVLIAMIYVLFRKPKKDNDLSLKLPVQV